MPSRRKEILEKLYAGYMFRATRVRKVGARGLRVEGTVCWTLAGKGASQIRAYLPTWDARGYKIGLLVRKGQRITRLAYAAPGGGEVRLAHDPGLTDELGRALGGEPGRRWLGFFATGARRKATLVAPNIVCFDVTLEISPAGARPQLVPVAARHLRGTFSDSYMPALWVLPPRPA
jgi:hypothetical protein